MAQLSTEIDHRFAEAAKGVPWLESLLAGERPDFDRLNTQELVRGLVIFSGALYEGLALVVERLDG